MMKERRLEGDVELKNALVKVFNRLLGCRSDEKVLLITDTEQDKRLQEALIAVLKKTTGEAQIIITEPRRFPGEEPPVPVQKAMEAADAVFFAGTTSITYSKTVEDARSLGTRFLMAVGITADILKRAVDVDYEKIQQKAERMRLLFRQATSATITCPKGSDLEMKLEIKRDGFIVDGFAKTPGIMSWIPAGSAHIAPDEGTAEGVIFINGSLVPLGILEEPIRFDVEKGFVTKISGGQKADEYLQFLKGFKDPNVFNIGELAVGVNPKAMLTGLPIEDERIEGGIVIGVGQNVLHGGRIRAKTHTDAISTGMNLELDARTVIKDGKLLV